MRVQTTYSVERDDSYELAPQRAAEALNLLHSSIHKASEETLSKGAKACEEGMQYEDFIGLRAYRKIFGSQFEASDVDTFKAYIDVLIKRHLARAEEMRAEGADKAFVDGCVATVRHAESITESFVAAFKEAVEKRHQNEPSLRM